MDDLTAVRESIDAVRKSLDHAVGELSKETARNRVTNRWLGALIVAVSVLGLGVWWNDRSDERAEDRQALADAEAACDSANDTRATLRVISKESGITSGVTGGEALITTIQQAGGTLSPETVETYRQVLTELLDPALTAIVNQLPARRWDPDTETCVDVEVGE